jgi:hypothetical protein
VTLKLLLKLELASFEIHSHVLVGSVAFAAAAAFVVVFRSKSFSIKKVPNSKPSSFDSFSTYICTI